MRPYSCDPPFSGLFVPLCIYIIVMILFRMRSVLQVALALVFCAVFVNGQVLANSADLQFLDVPLFQLINATRINLHAQDLVKGGCVNTTAPLLSTWAPILTSKNYSRICDPTVVYRRSIICSSTPRILQMYFFLKICRSPTSLSSFKRKFSFALFAFVPRFPLPFLHLFSHLF